MTENNTPPAAELSEGSDFDFYLDDGTVYAGKGHLLVTTAFVGLGQPDGSISFVVPLNKLFYAEKVTPDAEADEVADAE